MRPSSGWADHSRKRFTALERLEAHVAEPRRFAANASHELRTPLAITQTLLDVARNDPDRDAGELVDRLYFVNARAIELTEALLLLSRADQRSFTAEPVDLSPSSQKSPRKCSSLSQKNAISPSRPPAPSPSPAAHTRSCCR